MCIRDSMKGNIAAEITMNIRNAGQYHYKICQITEKMCIRDRLFDGSRMDKGFGWSLMTQPYRILSE